MQKSTIIISGALGVTLVLIVVFIISQNIALPIGSCASLGLSKLTPDDIKTIKENQQYEKILDLTNDDLSAVPKLKPLMERLSNKIDYNDQVTRQISTSEMKSYLQFIDQKFIEQRGFGFNKENDFMLIIEYNQKKYLLGAMTTEPLEGHWEFTVSEDPTIQVQKLQLTDADFKSIPEIKNAIDGIGKTQIRPFESAGMPEPEFYQYQKWFDQKWLEKYGNATERYSYFRYENNVYDVSFAIC